MLEAAPDGVAPDALPAPAVRDPRGRDIYYLDLFSATAELFWSPRSGAARRDDAFDGTNTPLIELIFKVTGDPDFTIDSAAAMTAPFVEELYKGLGIALLISIARDDSTTSWTDSSGARWSVSGSCWSGVFYFVRAFGETARWRPRSDVPDPRTRGRAVQPLPVHRPRGHGHRVLVAGGAARRPGGRWPAGWSPRARAHFLELAPAATSWATAGHRVLGGVRDGQGLAI